MHELFTTAIVPDVAVKEILKILQGLCAMTPVHQFERRVIFEGPKANPLTGISPSQLPGRKRENLELWKDLHKQLIRQSYYITVSYEIDAKEFGRQVTGDVDHNSHEEPQVNLDDLRGTLHFLDNPDPPVESKPFVSRLVIRIKDESRLPTFLNQLNYSYAREQIREGYYAYRDNVIYCLSRDLQHPSPPEFNSQKVPDTLPALDTYKPFDAENKWTLTASVEIQDGNQPTLVKRGMDLLTQAKQDFAGILEFEVTPRRQLDTRLLSYMQSMRS